MSRNKIKSKPNASGPGLIPRALKKSRTKIQQFREERDRLTIWSHSVSGEYPSRRSLTRVANRTNGRSNYKTLGLTQRRSYNFINRWFQCGTEAQIADAGGIKFFGQVCKQSGRKRKLTRKQMLKLFIHFLECIHEQECELSAWQFAFQYQEKYQVSISTILRYINIFARIRRKLIEGHELDEHNKETRLNFCEFLFTLGRDAYDSITASIDEAVVYTKETIGNVMTYESISNAYAGFQEICNNNRFTRRHRAVQIDDAVPQDNPVRDIHTWTVPPLVVLRVCFCF